MWFLIIFVAGLILPLTAVTLEASEVDAMAEKLDPELLSIAERGPAGLNEEAPVQVIVGLTHPLTDADEAALQKAGLKIRSRVGDVLTGTIAAGDLKALAGVEAVAKIEASRPMAPESHLTE